HAQRIIYPPPAPMQSLKHDSRDGAFFSPPPERLPAPDCCATPFAQAVVADVLYPATTPPGPRDAPRRIDNSLVRHVEFDSEFFEHRAPEPFDLLRGAALQLFETADAVAIHELFQDRKSTRLNSSHGSISYAVFCLK